MNACEYHAQTLPESLRNPVRKHDAQGIGEVKTPAIGSEGVGLALEFVMDCCDPEGLGHSLPSHVIQRAGRIAALLRPKPEYSGVGYTEPPPARCERCDSE